MHECLQLVLSSVAVMHPHLPVACCCHSMGQIRVLHWLLASVLAVVAMRKLAPQLSLICATDGFWTRAESCLQSTRVEDGAAGMRIMCESVACCL